MKHFALIGQPLGHSYSQLLFEEAVPGHIADYRMHEISSLGGLRRWIDESDISGFNVTIPYKEAILPLLDTLSPEAKAIGAVNCVKVSNGRLMGYNTDAPAFRQTLEETLSSLHLPLSTIHSALILGTGGAARAVAYALSQMGIKYTFVSRHPEEHDNAIGYKSFQLSTFLPASQALSTAESKYNPAKNFQLLVNATPVGMYPNTDASPWPSEFQLPSFNFQLCYDLIYNPSPTLLMRQAAAKGAKVVDGLAMLRLQAKLSRDIFFSDNTDYQPIAK